MYKGKLLILPYISKEKKIMFKEGQVLDLKLLKELELGNGKKKFLFETSSGKKLLIPVEHYKEYEFKVGQTVSCKIDRINCSGQVFLEPLNPKYKEGKVYAFKYYGYEKVITFLGDERYFAKVKDHYNRIVKIMTSYVPDIEINSEIRCKVEQIKKGYLILSLEKDPTPLQLHQSYTFDYLEDKDLPNLGMCAILKDQFGGNHFFQKHIFEVYQLQSGGKLEARVEGYNRMGDYKIEPAHPIYQLSEVYNFKFVRLHREEDTENETQAVVIVEDELGKEQTITQYSSRYLARNPANKLPARVDRIVNATIYLHADE